MPSYYKIVEILGLTKARAWLSFPDYYGITGLYSGLIGAVLIDFSWYGVLVMGLIGLIVGWLTRVVASREGRNSPFLILGSLAPVFVAIAPFIDLISISQFQSMIPWLVVVVGGLSIAKISPTRMSSLTA